VNYRKGIQTYSLRRKNNVNLATLNKYIDLCEILGSHDGDCENCHLLDCDGE
jgi:hypothetical protein